MQTQLSSRSTSASLDSAATSSIRFTPPAHVRRWTGRAALTLPLPSLAALRIAGVDSSSTRSGGGRN